MRTFVTSRSILLTLVLGIAAVAVASGKPGIVMRRRSPVVPHAPAIVKPMLHVASPGPISGFLSHPLLAQLPPLPRESAANTVRPNKRAVHPMAANGDSISIYTFYDCGSTQGQIYNTGCFILWRFNDAVNTGADELEDCYAPSDQPNTVANCSAEHTGNPWEETTLSTAGTWVFGTYDVTKNEWLAVVYLPVGSGVYLDTFSDQFDTDESGAFTASSGADVYIEATGLTGGSEKYEVYVEYTSVSAHCVFTAPAESPAAPLANALCNPNNDTGDLTTSSGTLQVAWPLSAADPAGTYSIVLWDVTAGERLAEREVTVSGASSGAMSITPAGGNASPNPAPAGTPGSTFAYDGQNDDSDSALTFSASGLGFTGQVSVAISDPTGQVVSTIDGNSNGGIYDGQSWNLQNAYSPANYPLDTWTATLIRSSTGAVVATHSFRLVGYQLQTEFENPVGTAVTLSTTPATTTLEFTNTGATTYGTGNADPVRGINFSSGSHGVVLVLADGASSTTGSCAGATSCQTETAVDSNGNSWSVVNYCSSTGTTEACSVTATPMTTSLATGASLTLSNVEYYDNSAAQCTGAQGCTATTTVLPQDGQTWSSTSNESSATNPVYFTQGSGGTIYAAKGHIYLYGYRTSRYGTLHANQEVHGYTVNAKTAGKTSVTYTSISPSSSGSADLVYAINIANESGAGTSGISKFSIVLPAALAGGIADATIDEASPTAWFVVNCSGASTDTICFQKGGGNNNGIVAGSNQTLYLDIPPPTSSFTYTDAAIDVTSPSTFGVTPDGTWTVFAGPTPGPDTVDSTALVGYSLDSAYMTVATSPQSVGEDVTKNIAFTVTNTGFGSDANPDYLDAIAIAVPTANAFNTFSVTNTGWSEEGSYVVGSNTYYVFGLCANQASSAYGPLGATYYDMPNCGQSTEQADAIGPGGTLNFTANLTSGTGSVSMLMYAHGANGNGWSASKSFSETVTTTSLDAGFSAVGASPPPAVSNGSIPSVGADTSSLGNYYVYTIQNTSSSGASNDVSSMTITVPGEDTSGDNGTDASGKAWTITSAPTLSGSGFSGCSVTSYSNATTAGGNGSIVIGGSGCELTPGGVMNVDFTAQAPYRVNDTYNFPLTALNGATNVPVTQTWTNDTEMQIVLSAALSVTIDPSTDATTGTDPSPTCGVCAFTAPSTISMGSIANDASVLGTDLAEVDVTTDASAPVGWKLYVSTSVNPSNTGGAYADEFVSDVDSSRSISGAGVNYDQTSLGVVPTTNPGQLLVDTGSGSNPRRNPFGLVMNYGIYIDGGPTSAEDSTVTYTFIAN